jgi:hypothetical protein
VLAVVEGVSDGEEAGDVRAGPGERDCGESPADGDGQVGVDGDPDDPEGE